MSRGSPILFPVVSKKNSKFSSISQILNSLLVILSLRCFCKLENFFFNLPLPLACGVHACVSVEGHPHMGVCTHMCACVWEPEADVSSHFDSFSTLIIEAGSLNQTLSS